MLELLTRTRRSQGLGGASQQRRKRQQGVAKQVSELLARAVGGAAVMGMERSGSSQGLVGHDGEGFQSDLSLDVATLSQAGSDRRASLDAGADVLAE